MAGLIKNPICRFRDSLRLYKIQTTGKRSVKMKNMYRIPDNISILKTCTTIVFLIFFMQAVSQPHGRKIEVSRTTPASTCLPEIPYKQALEFKLKQRVCTYGNPVSDSIIPARMHAFIATLHYGFAQHRPVVITPDMIWLLILQGFGIHIHECSPELRKKIILDEQADTTILVRNDDVRKNSSKHWEKVIDRFSDSVALKISPAFYDLFNTGFSTTTNAGRIAAKITLLNSIDRYFSYNLMTACGIPYIVLKGDTSDWKKICDRLDGMKGYGLDPWIGKLKVITGKIYETSKGNVDSLFWRSIYKYNEESGGSMVTGWITAFFPYICTETGDSLKYSLNEALWNNDRHFGDYHYTPNPEVFSEKFRGAETWASTFPCGYSMTRFRWMNIGHLEYMNLYGGFMAIRQDKRTGELCCDINWCLADARDKGEVEELLLENEKFWNRPVNEVESVNSCVTHYYQFDGITETPRYRCKDGRILELWEISEWLREDTGSVRREFRVVFNLDEKGQCSGIKFHDDCGEDIKDRIISAIQQKNAWIPAKRNGRPVAFKVVLEF